MSTQKVQSVIYQGNLRGRMLLRAEDNEAFERSEPDGFGREMVRAVQGTDGAWYPVTPECPDNGLPLWRAEATPEEAAKEAALAKLTAEERELLAPGFKTRAERVAAREAEIADAKAREQ